MEKQEFNLGDTVYFYDEDFKCFESKIVRISSAVEKIFYETYDVDFWIDDVGEWVFKSDEDRRKKLG